jgi:hypothetical protein
MKYIVILLISINFINISDLAIAKEINENNAEININDYISEGEKGNTDYDEEINKLIQNDRLSTYDINTFFIRFYAGGQLGYSKHVNVYFIEYKYSDFGLENISYNGYNGGISFGYDFNKMFSISFDYQMFTKTKGQSMRGKEDVIFAADDFLANNLYTSDLMVNLVYKFKEYKFMTYYMNFGAGVSMNYVKRVISGNNDYSYTLSSAFKIGIGSQFKINNKHYLFTEINYANLGKTSIYVDYFIEDSVDKAYISTKRNHGELLIGYTYKFFVY